jgi:hypothetical protein
VVATDDERIKNVCEGFGATVVMTAYDIPNGTERCNAAQLKLAEKYDIVVNIQVRLNTWHGEREEKETLKGDLRCVQPRGAAFWKSQ